MRELEKTVRWKIIKTLFTSLCIAAALVPLYHILIFPLTQLWQAVLIFMLTLLVVLAWRIRHPLGLWHEIHRDFPPQYRKILNKEIEFYTSLDEEGKNRFEKKMQYFLASVQVKGIDTSLSDRDIVLIGASAVIPVFRFPHWEYELETVLVYPRSFNEEFETEDGERNIQGMVLLHNAMILSQKSLEHGFKHPGDRHNVGIHEFAHKIDQADHSIDGVPARLLDQPGLEKRWAAVVNAEMQAIHEDRSDIDPYGGTSPVEFFAVASEYFFEDPGLMSVKHPELYEVMQIMYRQDMKNILTKDIRSIFRNKKHSLKRNSPCPCGSGMKYKDCCHKKHG